MTVLLTGASGFLGHTLSEVLQQNHELITLGRSAADISWTIPQPTPALPTVDTVVHAAGLAHQLKTSKATNDAMFAVNETGTRLLLEGLTPQPPRQLVFISTVAVYGRDTGCGIDETHPLEGKSAYARSKISAEQAVVQWGKAQGVAILVLRLPLISGTNPPGNLGAMIRAMRGRYYLRIGKGNARKSMVGARAVGNLIARLNGRETGIYNLTDGEHPCVSSIEDHLARQLNRRVRTLPSSVVSLMGKVGDRLPRSPITTERVEKITGSLTFSDAKARTELGWFPCKALDELRIL